MFLSYRSLLALALLLGGLVFGFGWYLSTPPSAGVLALGRTEALGYLLRSLDADNHFTPRYGLDGTPLPVTREDLFAAELEAAIALAEASRGDALLSGNHRANLGIILADWYTETASEGFLSNGTPTMAQNGQALRLLSASPLFEEERTKAEKLALPIASWARRELTTYWKAASSTPAESLGYGILGIASLYLRTGAPEHKETLELLAARYRLLLDDSPARLLVRATLHEALRSDEDRRSLLLSARSYLPLQDKNFFSASYGLFKNAESAYHPLAEQAMIAEGLARAAALATESGEEDVRSLKMAALRAAGALLRMQMDEPETLTGGLLQTLGGATVDTYATARLIEALEPFK
ncbi:MAG TPA: hypothetical protein VD967_01065 [Candidatus Paceibacterota bacterium]|nr:hypothetical protein [Candidatus Paceibacterota bacterium]